MRKFTTKEKYQLDNELYNKLFVMAINAIPKPLNGFDIRIAILRFDISLLERAYDKVAEKYHKAETGSANEAYLEDLLMEIRDSRIKKSIRLAELYDEQHRRYVKESRGAIFWDSLKFGIVRKLGIA